MKTESEFPQIGKRMTYKVPEGFFERITDETIAEARKRERSRGKLILIRQIAGVAAVMMALILAGYWMMNRMDHPSLTVEQLPGGLPDDTCLQNPIISVQKDNMASQSAAKKKVHESPDMDLSGDANLEDLLASLPDDELLFLAAQSEADIFTEENDKKQE
jgi:hypothetical protein